jgi:ribonuclease HII
VEDFDSSLDENTQESEKTPSSRRKPKRSKTRRETWRLKKLVAIEKQIHDLGYKRIAGLDEVGRGPLAGPVVAAACILPDDFVLRGINDSKKLDFDQRLALYNELLRHPDIQYGVGVVEAIDIDQINILVASLRAMALAVNRLPSPPDFLLVDGNRLPPCEIPGEAVIDGDFHTQVIAAASIIAKVTRDQIMIGYHTLYPQYGFDEHKGYGTSKHLEALRAHGPSPIHRKSFGTVKEIIQ